MSTSVIIVTFNSQNTLPACLKSVQAANPAETIIIDNTKNNRGFARAANLGAASATGDYLLFLNPDTLIPAHLIREIDHYFKIHPQTAIIAPQLINSSGQPEPFSFGPKVTPLSILLPSPFPSLPRACWGRGAGGEVAWMSGAALAIRRSVFNQIKGFDQQFFMYWEDVDLCRRAIRGGHQIVRLENIKVTHQRGASFASPKQKTKYYDISADKYFRKYYPAWICFSLLALRYLYRLFRPYSL